MIDEGVVGLKAGDEVLIKSLMGASAPVLAKIDRVTSSGRFIVGRSTFNPDGWERGTKGRWDRRYLRVPTDESRGVAILVNLRSRVLEAVSRDKVNAWDMHKLERVLAAILDAGEQS